MVAFGGYALGLSTIVGVWNPPPKVVVVNTNYILQTDNSKILLTQGGGIVRNA